MIHTLTTNTNRFVSFDSSDPHGVDVVQVRYVGREVHGKKRTTSPHHFFVQGSSVCLQSGSTIAVYTYTARLIWNSLVKEGWTVSASNAKYPFITAYIKTTLPLDVPTVLIERVEWLLRRHGCSESDRRDFMQEAAAGNYAHTIAVIQKWVHTDLCNTP